MLSVLVVNWNTKTVLRECLASIAAHPPKRPFEVLVLDNASTDGSAQMVREEFPGVRLIALPHNSGYAAGNNRLVAEAQGELLLTLNPDTAFEDDTLERAATKLETMPEVAALAVRLVGDDGATQRSVRGFPSILGILGDATSLGSLFPRSPLGSYRLPGFDYESEGPAPQPMGTFLLFRRGALAEIGDPQRPFDEAFPIFFNEVDLLFRLTHAGWKCWYVPDLHVRHYGGESTKQVRRSMIWESHRSLMRFLWKHHGRWWNVPGLLLLGLIVYAAAFVRARGYHVGFRA